MKGKIVVLQVLVAIVFMLALFGSTTQVHGSTPDPFLGKWFVLWSSPIGGGTSTFEVFMIGQDYFATVYIPTFGVFDETWPVTITGNSIEVGILQGTLTNGIISGDQIVEVEVQGNMVALPVTWEAFNVSQELTFDFGTEPVCENLPQLLCTGSAEYCSELVYFDPRIGDGYIDYPVNGEILENQYRSYLRRDLMQLIKYATAKMQCKTADWEFGSGNPLGLLDMSEADGSIPGTSIGSPGHPEGSHTDGQDIDVAYYQLYTPDNLARIICNTNEWMYETFHCTSEPYLLDPWRTALFTTYLAEHPHLRLMGVDGKVGPILEDSLDLFETNGWVNPALRAALPLIYEEENQGWGFYYHHQHHMHVSMNPVYPILLSFQFEPEKINLQSDGKYLTAYIELKEGFDPDLIDINSVFITVDGFSIISADPKFSEIGDYDLDGIPDLMVKFDRQAVQTFLSAGSVEITLYGVADGIFFQGADSILVK